MNAVLDGLALVFAPTNLLALGALGLLAGTQGRTIAAGVGILFVLGLIGGSLAIASALREPPAAVALFAVAAIAGVVVASAWSAPPAITAILAWLGGTALALNSPPQAMKISAAIASQVASGFGAIAMFAVVVLIAGAARQLWHHMALRIIASWIAASAILALALRLAR